MNRRMFKLAVVCGGLLLPAAAANDARAATKCDTMRPVALKATVSKGGTTAAVRWRIPKPHPAKLAFRVARDGADVGQTSGTRMQVRVSPSHPARITVTAVVGGRPTACIAAVRIGARLGRPARVKGLSARPRGFSARPRAQAAVLTWEPAAPGASPVAFYRLLRDGKPVRRTKARRVTVRATARAHRFQVVAIDRAGRPGPRSGRVIVRAGHVAPTKPAAPAVSGVTRTAATLSWRRSRAVGGRVARYRIVRNGRTVHTVKRNRARLSGLVPDRPQTFRIVAVDSAGWASRSSAPVTVRPRHQPPSAPGAPTATSVTDTAVSLAWGPAKLPRGSKLRGYRIMRDGRVVGQVPAAQATIGNLAPKSAHDWTVAAVDTLGYVSPPSPSTRIVQADPPPTAGGVHAYLLASTDASFADFRKHYQQVGVVYPTFYDCNRQTGQIEGANNERIVSFARDRKVRVLPRFNCQGTSMVHRILTEPALRTYWLNTMTALAEQYGYDGVNIDFEAIPAEDRDQLTAFIADLSDALHARGKLLSQAVSAKTRDSTTHPRSGAFDYPALAKYDDWVFVMAWGVHWSTSAPGAQDDYQWVRQVRDYVATMPYQQKFVMGTMLYGMDWPAGGGPEHEATALNYPEIQALIARYGRQPVYDAEQRSWHLSYTDAAGVGHDVWYSDAGAVGDRVALAQERGLKVGFWRIGQEDERIWADPRLPSGW
jgi:spore germination protein YaaH